MPIFVTERIRSFIYDVPMDMQPFKLVYIICSLKLKNISISDT